MMLVLFKEPGLLVFQNSFSTMASGFGLILPIPHRHGVLHHSSDLWGETLLRKKGFSIIIYHQ
jgi:hypothetical protein